jgi:hypothetical protein
VHPIPDRKAKPSGTAKIEPTGGAGAKMDFSFFRQWLIMVLDIGDSFNESSKSSNRA